MIFEKSGNFKDAIELATKARDLAPNYRSAWILQVHCNSSLGNTEGANYAAFGLNQINPLQSFESTNVDQERKIFPLESTNLDQESEVSSIESTYIDKDLPLSNVLLAYSK